MNKKRIASAFFSLLTTVSLAPANWDIVGPLIPADWKPKVFAVAALATLILRSCIAKDK